MGVIYGVVGWLILQFVTFMISNWCVPAWVHRVVFISLLVGFPIALMLAWAADLTSSGEPNERDTR
ncbi:MAG: hypothetical protein AAF004_16385 [Pseudomonadota bacterium]